MFACQIAIYVLIGLHGLLALYLLYLNCSCSINLQFELFGGIGSRRSRRMKVNKSVEKKLDISRDEEAQAREDEEAAKLFRSNQTTLGVQTEVQGLYLYPYRQDMQEPNLLGGRNAKNTATTGPMRLPWMSRDGSLATSWETTPQARAAVAEGGGDIEKGLGVTYTGKGTVTYTGTVYSGGLNSMPSANDENPRAQWGFAKAIGVQTDAESKRNAQRNMMTSTEKWSNKDQSVGLDPIVVSATHTHSDMCFAYYYNYPAIGSIFSGPWRCSRGRFYNGVAIQIEFDNGGFNEWEPQGFRRDFWGRTKYEKRELIALVEERASDTTIAVETHKVSPDDGGDTTIVPSLDINGASLDFGTKVAKGALDDGGEELLGPESVRRVAWVCSYVEDDDTLVVSGANPKLGHSAYGHSHKGHSATGKKFKLIRQQKHYGSEEDQRRGRSKFAGAWMCENNEFYQGRIIEIEPDGDAHRWFPHGGSLANYIKTDLIDLVEIDQESSSRYLPVSIDDGGRADPTRIENHYICSLGASKEVLTVSPEYGNDGHCGSEVWQLHRIKDCGGEALSTQLFARTYKYVHASSASHAAWEEATTHLNDLQSLDFNGAREHATKVSTLGIAQAWSIQHLNMTISRRNEKVLDAVATILRRFPELVCEVHGTTSTPR